MSLHYLFSEIKLPKPKYCTYTKVTVLSPSIGQVKERRHMLAVYVDRLYSCRAGQ